MKDDNTNSMKVLRLGSALRVLLGLACFVVIVAGMRAAAEILVPFLLACFLSILCAPLLVWLERHRVPSSIAVTMVVLLLVVAVGVISLIVGSSISEFSTRMPEFQERLGQRAGAIAQWLSMYGIHISENILQSQINPARIMSTVAVVISSFGNVLANFVLIIFMIFFILLEAAGFPAKVRRAMGEGHIYLITYEAFSESVKQYLIIKSLISLGTGLLVGVWLTIQGVDYVALWVLLAFLLNFIPNIGSFIAGLPAVLMSFLQLGPEGASITLFGYFLINTIMGNVVEPKYLGSGLGLSALVVFLSLLFWGWVLGPVGMILSIPLTMIIKMALDVTKSGKWFAVLLSGKQPVAQQR